MKTNYVTLVYLSQDEENANYLAEILEDSKHVEVHKFEKGEDYDQDIIKDINDSCGLIILHISDEFDYGDYLAEIRKERLEKNRKESTDFAEKEKELREHIKKARAGEL